MNQSAASPLVRMDPARAAAGVITGIGFLGAGTIIRHKNAVVGLTTAASIWVVAAIGIILGLGEYDLSILATLLVLLTLFILDRIKIRADHYKEVTVEGRGGAELYPAAAAALRPLGVAIKDYGIELHPGEGRAVISLVIRFKDPGLGRKTVEALSALPGVTRVAWL